MIKDSNEALKLKSLIIPQNLLEAAQILKTTGPDALLNQQSIGEKSKNNTQEVPLPGEYPSKKVRKETILTELKGVRQKFKDFYALISSLPNIETGVKQQYDRLQDDINFKKQRVLLPETLSDYFEKLCQKVQSNANASKKNWNEDETIFLVSVMSYWTYVKNKDHKKMDDESWRCIESMFPGRSMDQIKQRWHNLLKFYISKDPWTPEEDRLMCQIVESRKSLSDWKGVAQELNEKNPTKVYRSAKQCRERWNNHVNPAIDRGPWTPEQDIKLVTAFIELGKKWSQIAKELGTRTENAVKNRWHSLIRRVGVIDSASSDMTELEEREKAKQLLKLISEGSELEKGARSDLLVNSKGSVLKDKQLDVNLKPPLNLTALHPTHGSQKKTVKKAVSNREVQKNNGKSAHEQATAADVQTLAEKIQSIKKSDSPKQGSLPQNTAVKSVFESQLLQNLSFISNSKPSLQTPGSGTDGLPQLHYPKPLSGVQLETSNLQFSPIPLAKPNGITFQLQQTLAELATSQGTGGAFPILSQNGAPAMNSTTSVTAVPIGSNNFILPQSQQQQSSSINPKVEEPEPSSNQEKSISLLSQKEQLKKLASELETTLQQNAKLAEKQKAESENTRLPFKIEQINALEIRSLEEMLLEKPNKFQFSLFNKENNSIIPLDPLTPENFNLIKELYLSQTK